MIWFPSYGNLNYIPEQEPRVGVEGAGFGIPAVKDLGLGARGLVFGAVKECLVFRIWGGGFRGSFGVLVVLWERRLRCLESRVFTIFG